MGNNVETRSLEYLLFHKKNLIGCFVVAFLCGPSFDRVSDVGQITNITGNDAFFMMRVDDNLWLIYSWDIILPEVTEDDKNIVIHDKISDVKYIILKIGKK